MQVHLSHRYVWDIVVILEDGNLLHLRCPHCDMMVPWCALNRRHFSTAQCDRGAEQKQMRLVEEELWESLDRAFQAYSEPL